MTEEQSKPKKNYWMYASIGLAILVILLLLGKNKPEIDFAWVVIGLAVYVTYLGYKYYILKIKTPNLSEMIRIIKKEEVKRGVFIDDHPNNVIGEPGGKDLFYVTFIEQEITYIIFKNVLIGRTVKTIAELQIDNERNAIQRILAEKGITEVIEQ